MYIMEDIYILKALHTLVRLNLKSEQNVDNSDHRFIGSKKFVDSLKLLAAPLYYC